MDTITTTTIADGIAIYITSLDWPYMLTLILLCFVLNHISIRKRLQQTTGRKVPTRLRVLITGLLYGTVVYFLRGADPHEAEKLVQSFVFAVVFHKLLLQGLFTWLARNGLSRSLARHVLSDKDLKDIYGA